MSCATDGPDPILSGMLLLIGHLYENRQAVITGTIATELPMTVKSLWFPFRADL